MIDKKMSILDIERLDLSDEPKISNIDKVSAVSDSHGIELTLVDGTKKKTTVLEFLIALFQEVIKRGTTEVYFQTINGKGAVRYGVKKQPDTRFDDIPPEVFQQICNCVCLLSKKDHGAMRHFPLKSVLKVHLDHKDYDFLFTSLPVYPSPVICLHLN